MPIKMFLRIKKRVNPSGKIYEYAYWVANKYRKRRKMPKQKVKQYLGRVYRFEKVSNKEIEQLGNQQGSGKDKIKLLLENELKNYGFEQKEGVWRKENCLINIEQGICVDNEGKNICIAINDGLLHQSTINSLIVFKPKESLEKGIGKQLANALISAGIRPKEAVFIDLFREIMRQVIDDSRQQATTPGNTKQ